MSDTMAVISRPSGTSILLFILWIMHPWMRSSIVPTAPGLARAIGNSAQTPWNGRPNLPVHLCSDLSQRRICRTP